MEQQDQKNLIMAMALCMLVFVGWQYFFEIPAQQRAEEARQQREAAVAQLRETPDNPVMAEAAAEALPRDEALALAARVPFDTPRIDGGISLIGGRIDDLSLKDYHVTIEPGAAEVNMFSPARGEAPYFASFGWIAASGMTSEQTPNRFTEWAVESGDVLTPETPVTLVWDNDAGQVFRQTYSVDADYMFTIEQSVENTGGAAVSLAPFGEIRRVGEPKSEGGGWLVHEGAIGAFDGRTPRRDYGDLEDLSSDERIKAEENGWIGFTDKYWLTAIVPNGPFHGDFAHRASPLGKPTYITNAISPAITAEPGETRAVSTRMFAGAKSADILRDYQDNQNVSELYEAIDWGWFFFLTKPFFWLLNEIYKIVGNFAVSIVLLTVVVKAVMFPLAYKSYASMARMKKLQPETEKIRERHKDDPQAMQKAMIGLYRQEKVNPAAGCLPILLQIPVFFSLYKVLFVSLEMRHAYGFGWIQDLSAPDPTSIFNLFGLLSLNLPTFLLIGILPLIMGVTMWLQQQLNPAPTDPTQKMIFAWMPVIFTFMLGSFPAGLVLYWIANNVLTITQQAAIMRTQGVKVELWDNIKRLFSRGSKSET